MVDSAQFGNNTNSGFQADYVGIPFLFRNGELTDNARKEAHDSYQIYVNKDYIGNKMLLTQVDNVNDVSKYLHNQGFENFSAKLEGNQYIIESERNEAHDIKRTLNVYLNNR